MRGESATETVRVGIMSYDDYKKRTIDIARGVRKKSPNEPTIWFDSIQTLTQVLSDENRALLSMIREKKPNSISELGRISGRKAGNLSRTLNRLAEYGIVEFYNDKNKKVPRVRFADFEVHLELPETSSQDQPEKGEMA